MEAADGQTEDDSSLPFYYPAISSSEEKDCNRKGKMEGRRQLCWEGCGRPQNACICPHLPPNPIPTTTQVVILHHPHELRQKLSTVPALTRSILHCHTIPGRRLRPGLSPFLDALPRRSKAIFLFPTFDPSSPAKDLSQWAASEGEKSGGTGEVVLIVFDGTWKHAKEMVAASLPFLSGFAEQVALAGGWVSEEDGDSIFESDLVLRKEPFRGCMSTMEAVARALRVLEPDGKGEEIEERLLAVLRAIVRVQACHLRPTKPRVKLRKKGKNGGREGLEKDEEP